MADDLAAPALLLYWGPYQYVCATVSVHILPVQHTTRNTTHTYTVSDVCHSVFISYTHM